LEKLIKEEIVVDEEVKDIMADLLEIAKDEITDNTSFEDTESWDSLKHMEIIGSLEEKYDVLFTADEIVAMLSVKKIKEFLKEKLFR
jgi:acyl carrier protein